MCRPIGSLLPAPTWSMGQAHYFIKGDVEPKMLELERIWLIAQDTAGMRSWAKSEIVVI